MDGKLMPKIIWRYVFAVTIKFHKNPTVSEKLKERSWPHMRPHKTNEMGLDDLHATSALCGF